MDQARPDVQIRIPADASFVSVLRTATASLAARLDFTLDEIEDLRIAVDEACALVLPQASPGTELECAFHLAPGVLTVDVRGRSVVPRPPARDSFAWTVLTALTSHADFAVDDDALTISLTRTADIPTV